MKEENLRQAILAIAVSLDIKEEEYTKRVSAGVDLRQLEDPAFFILNNALLQRFKDAWFKGISAERTGTEKGLPPLQHLFPSRIISALIQYVALELSWSVYRLPVEITQKALESHYYSITARFRHASQDDMLTELASRKCVYEAIRNHLIKSNIRHDTKMRNMLLHSNRPEIVFNMFKEYFREHSATAFRFEGSYIDFVMNAYQNYFYANNKADIWRAFSADDYAKREVEMDLHAVRYLDRGGVPADMYVHDHLINIGEANNELFLHSGHRDKDSGIMCDAYYAIICHLCEEFAERVNEKLEGFRLEFKDPYSRLEGTIANKSIGAKISNAKQVLYMMFDYIRAGNFNVSRLLDFRRECFRLGRGDTQSNNPVWVCLGASNSGESARYLDTEKGINNFITFEIVFKAVASIYNLMRALQDRGRDLVTEYIKGRPERLPNGVQPPFSDWFINDNVYRYMDYLSSLEYLPLMRKLQRDSAEKVGDIKFLNGEVNPHSSHDLGSGELLDFEGMLNLYAGSSKNTNTNITANRRYDTARGLLDRPKLRGRDALTTPFERKRSVYSYMTAIPYSFMEVDRRRKADYVARQRQERVQNVYVLREFPGVVLDYRGPRADNSKHMIYNTAGGSIDYATELYTDLSYNSVLARNNNYAKQHLAAAAKNGVMNTLDWHIGTADFPCMFQIIPDQAGPQPSETGTQQKWFTHLYMHCPMLNVAVASFSSTQEGSDIVRAFWHQIPRDHETAWLLEGRGYRRHGCLPMCDDLHTITLAGGIKSTLEEPYVEAEKILAKYPQARERLEKSMGFALYIGLDNIGKPEIKKDVLERIPVYQDYTAQVEFYRERIVELSWMQADYIELLQMMFTWCWYVTLPGSNFQEQEVRRARSLFNSLLTTVFSKEDIEWFFHYLRISYCDESGRPRERHAWPHRIVDYSSEKNSDARREPMTPRWALTLQCQFASLVDDLSLTPPTKFEDGPYEQFMQKARDCTDIAERFVMLHAFLYEKTLHTKLLRDAFTLTFGALPEDNNTLSCELNSMLGVTKVFDPNDSSWVQNIAFLKGSTYDAGEFVRDLVLQDNRDFSVLLNALSGHYAECTDHIRELVNYDVAVDAELSSKFDKWGDVLSAVPPVTNSEILNQIRGQFVCDAHHYFFAGNDYFKADYGGDTLYLHYSGHFLRAARDGQYEPFSLPTGTSRELYTYEEVLKRVMSNVSYAG